MNGGTILSAVGGWTLPDGWVLQSTGDFNGDGKKDLLWRQTGTGIISIWLMNGGTILSISSGWSAPTDWLVRGCGDFDGDGKADILWQQSGTGAGSVWRMNGGSVLSISGGWSIPTDWQFQALGDYNGDGKADILWRQNGSGQISLWMMNGGAVQSFAGGWSAPTDWGTQTPGPNRVTLAWQDNSTTETGFRVERSRDGSTNWTEVGTTGSNVAIFQDAGLPPYSTYFYRVRAYNGTDTSPYSNATSATTP
jgi:hypothetical protein